MARILLIEPHIVSQSAVVESLVNHDVIAVPDAETAIEAANEREFDVVVMELSLAGHSCIEFLYEFRTYSDWRGIPVLIYSSIDLDSDILKSSAWEKLGIYRYLYKPKSSLSELQKYVDKSLGVRAI